MGQKHPVWFVDLDNTLHDASHAIFPEINRLMTRFVANCLSIDEHEATRVRENYWRRYGATLLGLVRHHASDPDLFLNSTHAFANDAERLRNMLKAERGLHRALDALPGRKVLVTNAPLGYTRAILLQLRLQRHFERTVSIESMRLFGHFRPKPSRSLMLHLAAKERVTPTRIILIDDSPANLKSAKSCKMRTVRILGASVKARQRGKCPLYIDRQVQFTKDLRRISWHR